MQETVLRVWQQAPHITGSMRSYLFRTARNIMIDNYRKAQRRPLEARDRELADPAGGAERVDQLLNRVLMEEALLRLSAEHRDVLVALDYRRYTVQEASVSLNIPSGNSEVPGVLRRAGPTDDPRRDGGATVSAA